MLTRNAVTVDFVVCPFLIIFSRSSFSFISPCLSSFSHICSAPSFILLCMLPTHPHSLFIILYHKKGLVKAVYLSRCFPISPFSPPSLSLFPYLSFLTFISIFVLFSCCAYPLPPSCTYIKCCIHPHYLSGSVVPGLLMELFSRPNARFWSSPHVLFCFRRMFCFSSPIGWKRGFG